MSRPALHHHLVGDETASHWVYVLPGIFGAGRNWASLARRLVSSRTDWGAILVDLRLHGHSRGFAPPHTLGACLHDLIELTERIERRPTAVLGHSFGGKIALMSASALAPAQVWVIDSPPGRRTPGGSAYRMLQILRRLAGPFANRAEAVAALEAEGLASHVAHWMATNLVLEGGTYRWSFAVSDMESLLDDFFRRDLWDVIEAPLPASEIHLVRASESDVLTDAEMERIGRAGVAARVFGHQIHGGHWLHVDNQEGLLKLLEEVLP